MAASLRLLGITVLSLACAGCSFLFADAAPSQHEKMLYFDCTSTPGLEVADGVLSLGSVLAGVSTLNQSEAEFKRQNDGGDRDAAATVNFVMAGVFAGSAIYGIVVTENCGDAKSDLRQRIIERERQRPRALPPLAAPAPARPPPAPAAPSPAEETAPLPPAPPSPAPPPASAPPASAAPLPPPPKPGAGSF